MRKFNAILGTENNRIIHLFLYLFLFCYLLFPSGICRLHSRSSWRCSAWRSFQPTRTHTWGKLKHPLSSEHLELCLKHPINSNLVSHIQTVRLLSRDYTVLTHKRIPNYALHFQVLKGFSGFRHGISNCFIVNFLKSARAFV